MRFLVPRAGGLATPGFGSITSAGDPRVIQLGAEVRIAATVSAALEIINQWKPDVLVSDIGMPSETDTS
jgi:CheY-like chemotaxis protein